MSFSFTSKQDAALDVIGSSARHILLEGGSRSGKTFIILHALVLRALAAKGSRHAVLRFRFNHVKASVVHDTFPKMMALCFPDTPYKLDKTDWFAEFPNKSQIWFGGLDDKERTEKILGQEYCLDPNARVLKADLVWMPARHLRPGDELIAFPENLEGHQKLVPSKVEGANVINARRFRIKTNRGDTIVSEHHRFVAHYDDRRHRNFRQFSWRMAKDLKAGDMIRFACEPWYSSSDSEFADGWLSGMLDGEGWVSRDASHVGVAQNPGPVLNRLREEVAKRGVEFAEYVQKGTDCIQLRASGLWASLRLLGTTRTTRLLPKAKQLWEGCRAFRKDGKTYHEATITAIEDLGVGPVVSLQTSSRTLIADGFLGHNCTIFFNEVSQIPLNSMNLALTRLAQLCIYKREDKEIPLRLKAYYDCNPPSKAHWAYQLFHDKKDPETKKPIVNGHEYTALRLNPQDNSANLPVEYMQTLEALPLRMRKRFLLGEYAEVAPGALWTDEMIDQHRVDELPDMVRIVVAVDPSGSGDEDNAGNDEIGIVVAGLGNDGRAYVLEDVTVKAGPKTWGAVATSAYDRHMADKIVAETNFGGEMVKFVVQAAKPGVPFRKLTASRGKHVRAEPISALTEQGKIRFAGTFPQLEDELCAFTTNGYIGQGSPNRADAMVWAMSELFPGLVKKDEKKKQPVPMRTVNSPSGWLAA